MYQGLFYGMEHANEIKEEPLALDTPLELPVIEFTASLSSPYLERSQFTPFPPFIITITAVLHAPRPITILKYDSIFESDSDQILRESQLQFVNTRTSIAATHDRGIYKCFYQKDYELKRSHGAAFINLYPEDPHIFQVKVGPFEEQRPHIQRRWPGNNWDWYVAEGLEVDESYRLALNETTAVNWWKWGIKKQVLTVKEDEKLQGPRHAGEEGKWTYPRGPDGRDPITLDFKDPPTFRVIEWPIKHATEIIVRVIEIIESDRMTCT